MESKATDLFYIIYLHFFYLLFQDTQVHIPVGNYTNIYIFTKAE